MAGSRSTSSSSSGYGAGLAGSGTGTLRVHKRRVNDQQKRREIALKLQNEHREDVQVAARQVASDFLYPSSFQGELGEEVDFVQGLGNMKGSKARTWFARRFMRPEFMTEIPPRLDTEWYVMSLPAGERCCAVSFNGTTVTRLQRSGSVFHRFNSPLPSGNPSNNQPHLCCVLDCIFHEPDRTYYVLDIMCWKTFSLLRSTTEVRFRWLYSKVRPQLMAGGGAIARGAFQFTVLPIHICNGKGLQAAYDTLIETPYGAQLPFVIRGGLLFVNRYSHYVNDLTPLSLLWMDQKCSGRVLELIDTFGNQRIFLQLQPDGTLWSGDDPPVICGTVSRPLLHTLPKPLLAGGYLLLEFCIPDDQELLIVDGKPLLCEEQFRAVVQYGAEPLRADNCAKILFQHQTRNISFQRLLSSVLHRPPLLTD